MFIFTSAWKSLKKSHILQKFNFPIISIFAPIFFFVTISGKTIFLAWKLKKNENLGKIVFGAKIQINKNLKKIFGRENSNQIIEKNGAKIQISKTINNSKSDKIVFSRENSN